VSPKDEAPAATNGEGRKLERGREQGEPTTPDGQRLVAEHGHRLDPDNAHDRQLAAITAIVDVARDAARAGCSLSHGCRIRLRQAIRLAAMEFVA